ncbi:MAG TPA: M48 family metallopeptidase [Patescibacteria group bacterium]|nr:M48 family metallopeptidase [Patescibacteria group bacterium]
MKKQIRLREKDIEYTLRTSNRARRMRLAIYCDGDFVVTVPSGMRPGLVEQFILTKSQWILDKLEYFSSLGKKFFTKTSGGDFFKHKEEALFLAENRIRYFNAIYQFAFSSINIKNQKTRWGSCSKKGNLNFSYKIALLPQQLSDYIIVHELCHLGEFNHSKKFWNLVEKTVPDYLALRTELKNARFP